MSTKEQQMSFSLAATTCWLVVEKSMDVLESTCSCESIHWKQFPYGVYYPRVLKVCAFVNVIDYTHGILFVHPS
jgi:hypothetical protein